MACKFVERVAWSTVKNTISGVNAEFAEAADFLFKDLKTDPPIFRVAYPYGRAIVEKGSFQAPCGSETCSECRDLLHETVFSRIPLSLLIKNDAEVHLTRQGKDFNTVPLRIMACGQPFGVFEVLDKIIGTADTRPPWSVSSGARSMVIVAPIGDRRLGRAFATPIEWTKNEPHWKLIQELSERECPWRTEVIVFSSSFVELLSERKRNAERLFTLLLRVGWQQSSVLRHASSHEAALRRIYLEGPAKAVSGQLPELQQFATVQHLFDIAEGSFPAFVPCHQERCSLGPFKKCAKLIHDALGTMSGKHKGSTNDDSDDYMPVVLYPYHLAKAGDFGYYSFRFPTLVSASSDIMVRNFSELPFDIKRCVDMLAKLLPHKASLDVEQTRYFAQSGRFDLSAAPELFKDLGSTEHERRAFGYSQFFVAGVRVVRRD